MRRLDVPCMLRVGLSSSIARTTAIDFSSHAAIERCVPYNPQRRLALNSWAALRDRELDLVLSETEPPEPHARAS